MGAGLVLYRNLVHYVNSGRVYHGNSYVFAVAMEFAVFGLGAYLRRAAGRSENR